MPNYDWLFVCYFYMNCSLFLHYLEKQPYQGNEKGHGARVVSTNNSRNTLNHTLDFITVDMYNCKWWTLSTHYCLQEYTIFSCLLTIEQINKL